MINAYDDNIYLKQIEIFTNKRLYRKYELKYREDDKSAALISIIEYNNQAQANDAHLWNDESDEDPELIDSGEKLPDGEIDIYNFYVPRQELAITPCTSIPRNELKGNPWSFHIVDFTGIGSSDMPGHYYYHWIKNQAILVIENIRPEMLPTLILILARYHKSLYQLITEINLFMAENAPPNLQDRSYTQNKKQQVIV